MDDLITPHDFVDDCDCHQCALRTRNQLRTEVDRLRNIEAASVAAVDFDQWQGDKWYEAMIALQKALSSSHEALCQNCDGTGDVTNQIGEYLGPCNCGAPSMFQAEMSRIDAERYRFLRSGKLSFDAARNILNDVPSGIDEYVDKAIKDAD